MNRNSILCAALATAGALAAPSLALADSSLVAGPVKAKGYQVTITASDAATDSFSVMAFKKAGTSQQMHTWTFSKGVKVSIKGGKASIKGNLGRYGKINAKVTAGKKVKGTVPAGCTGTAGSARKGTLAKTKLVLDSTFFKTFAPKSMKAQIVQGGKLECTGTGSGGNGGGTASKGLMLMSSADGADGMLMVNVVKQDGKVTQMVTRTDAAAPSAPASVFHMITSTTGASGLEAAADFSTATVAGTNPFLAGTLSFSGEGMGTMASGTVSGDFLAKFDSIGAQSLPAGNDAMLMQR